MEWRNGILLSYETLTNQWMMPGGGLEPNESENDCCIREVAEETGKIIQPSECLLEIEEYYEEWKWVNQYYIGEVVGDTEKKRTEQEKSVGMEARWLPVDEIMDIFLQYNLYANSDEMRRGMYLRECTELCEI